jgi:outer membrane protein TolC
MRMQMGWRVALGAVVLAFAGHAYAQISLSSAVDLALKNDRRVRIAQADLKKADAELSQTHDAFIPVVTVDGGYGKSVDVPQGLPTVFNLATQSVAFNINQVQAIKAAQNGLHAAILSLKDVKAQVMEDVTVTYISLDAAERRQAAMGEEFGLATKLSTIVQERLDAGQDTRIDLLHAKRTAAGIRLAQLQADDEVSTLQDHLARIIGLPGVPIATVPASIPPMTVPAENPLKAPVSPAIVAAFANAESKREQARGEALARFLPQLILSGGFSKIDVSERQSNFLDYYPDFRGKKDDSASIGIQIRFALFDRGQFARAREAAAEAARSEFQAEFDRDQFLEGRFKLAHSRAELIARTQVMEMDFELAQEQLKTTMIQLENTGGDANAVLTTPKDEQNARLQEREKFVDVLDAELELRKAEINLMRQTGTLDEWVNQTIHAPAVIAPSMVAPANP